MAVQMMAPVAISPEDEAAAAYLGAVGPIVTEGSQARQALVGVLTDLREAGSADGAAGLVERHAEAFRLLRQRLGRLTLPRSCGRCHAAVARWLELHEAACMTIAAGGPKGLAKAAELVADARTVAQEFTGEYARLTAVAQALAEAAASNAPTAAPTPRVNDEAQVAIEDAADADAEEVADEAPAEESGGAVVGPREALDGAARRNGDAAWVALSIVAQHRGKHASGPFGSWLAAVEGVLAASAAMTAFLVAAEVALD